jgi:RimJ/RimL family protein N-acetyltransferase
VSGPSNPNNYLFTRRLGLRLLDVADAAAMSRLLEHDSEALQLSASMADPMTLEAAQEWISRRTAPDQRVFGILLMRTGEFIGSIGFGGPKQMPHVGYWIGRPHWNRGYATEAVLGLIEYARWLGIPSLQADTFPNNPSSARVLLKAGFVYMGQVTLHMPGHGGDCELNHYEIKLSSPATRAG